MSLSPCRVRDAETGLNFVALDFDAHSSRVSGISNSIK